MPPVEDNTAFSNNEHLKSSILIKKVMSDGCSVFSYPLKCYFLLSDSPVAAPVQLAVMVPKKRFHHAVDRNRLKRLMRESYRLNKSQLTIHEGKTLYMCWMAVTNEMPSQQEVHEAVVSIFNKINTETK